MKNQLAVFTVLCFVMSSTILPTFAELHTNQDSSLEDVEGSVRIPSENCQMTCFGLQ